MRRVDVNERDVRVHSLLRAVQQGDVDPGPAPVLAHEVEQVHRGELRARSEIDGDTANAHAMLPRKRVPAGHRSRIERVTQLLARVRGDTFRGAISAPSERL